ncbi:nucleotide sugar dehydrogenase [Acidimicrobiia bacterium]|jgi:UDPglucose 6-dehydrogenase|nr:nucleotide sugar dehydrogenase [Acidimicrobiia bacterium]MDA8964006.1 nucleotide sugar dehydrogenase [Acidimicrobiia bacterium]MDA9862962.1 nucleotide sugar dehydrogenase [Acidimicrobiia bacterium]MDB0017606.1 nucleotide sugar dehydrogenase [Acidimicrobiia bacterium]MDB4604814.1 nucleotide sugar dehydrogenase [Acidimicrobiia bacterium]
MNLVVIGTGYVGLVTGVGFASLGNSVSFVDLDENKVSKLKDKQVPFYEPGLEEHFQDNETFSRMSFTSLYEEIDWEDTDVAFICVQTPNNLETNSVDTTFLESAITEINNLNNPKLVVTVKSTIPPYEIEKVCNKVGMDKNEITFNPEFLREGTAIEDFFQPDRIVIGGNDPEKLSVLRELYKGFEAELIETDPISSQLIKYLANTYLPLRLSFVNEAARLIDYSNGNQEDVLKGVGLDSRIGSHYFRPSPAWGGSCFPKDLIEVNNFYKEGEVMLPLISNIIESNDIQTKWTVDKLTSILINENMNSVLLIGAAFKEDTDDLRNSPTLDIYKMLHQKDINTFIYDEMVELDEYNSVDNLDDISEKTLVVLMYPIKKTLMERIESIITDTNSILYTPW